MTSDDQAEAILRRYRDNVDYHYDIEWRVSEERDRLEEHLRAFRRDVEEWEVCERDLETVMALTTHAFTAAGWTLHTWKRRELQLEVEWIDASGRCVALTIEPTDPTDEESASD